VRVTYWQLLFKMRQIEPIFHAFAGQTCDTQRYRPAKPAARDFSSHYQGLAVVDKAHAQ